jgi:hypothetical protein
MVMVTPSGLTQLPWVSGAVLELVVLVAVGDGLGDGLGEEVGLGLGDAVGLGDGEGLGDDVATLKATLEVAVLPEVSVARATRLWLPAVRPETATLHEVVPLAALHAPPSSATLTPARPLLSEAVPATVRLLLAVLPLEGVETSTLGGAVSALDRPPPAARAGVTATRPRRRPRARAMRARRGVRTGGWLHWVGTGEGVR